MKSYCRSMLATLMIVAIGACTSSADSHEAVETGAVPADEPSSDVPSSSLTVADARSEQAEATPEAPPTSEPEAVTAPITHTGDGTIYSGVYTAAQAARGREIQENECSSCHTTDDWSGGRLLTNFTGQSTLAFVEHIRSTMPLDGPGRLTYQQYVDLAALILEINGVPPGEKELPPEESQLADFRMEYRR